MIGDQGGALTFKQMIDGLERTSPPDYSVWQVMLGSLTLSLIVCWLVAVAASRFVNINRFSLHEIYRNRLTRAFLGASRARNPDAFTGFDEDDDVQMHELWPRERAGEKRSQAAGGPSEASDSSTGDAENDNPGDERRQGDSRDEEPLKPGWRPFHILNLTLNIVSSERLAWQERKAAPFTISPLHCGTSSKSSYSGKEAGNRRRRSEGAYRPSSEYGGAHGMSLGTAMAISGAAANPNMGYHSSPAVTFLLTIFNLRLGWWLGNPGPEGDNSYRRDGPSVAIRPLVQEIFGLTTDTREYVNLSDGGHFDNLGLYEMVRRRCRFILIADASCDPGYAFADLGNTVRKVSIDLGVSINFRQLQTLKRRPLDGSDLGPDCSYHAIGEIDYQTADNSREVKNGVILYTKIGYHGTECADVRSYAIANPDFPHQSTMNQWFSESQFESYRSLGFEIMDELLRKTSTKEPFASEPNLNSLGTALQGSELETSNNVVAFQQR
jgi:hypothetical protein